MFDGGSFSLNLKVSWVNLAWKCRIVYAESLVIQQGLRRYCQFVIREVHLMELKTSLTVRAISPVPGATRMAGTLR